MALGTAMAMQKDIPVLVRVTDWLPLTLQKTAAGPWKAQKTQSKPCNFRQQGLFHSRKGTIFVGKCSFWGYPSSLTWKLVSSSSPGPEVQSHFCSAAVMLKHFANRGFYMSKLTSKLELSHLRENCAQKTCTQTMDPKLKKADFQTKKPLQEMHRISERGKTKAG